MTKESAVYLGLSAAVIAVAIALVLPRDSKPKPATRVTLQPQGLTISF